MLPVSSVISFGVDFILAISATIVGSLIVWVFRNSIVLKVKRSIYYIFNTSGEISVTRVDKYTSQVQNKIDHGLFKQIQQEVDSLTFDSISDNRLRVEIEDLTTALVITIEADTRPAHRNVFDSEKLREGQKVVIKTDPAMRFGYRSGDLDKFREISEKISENISSYCFNNENPSESFVLGELRTKNPQEEDINDENLGLSATFKDSKMIFNLKNPNNLTRGVRAYFQPLKSYN